MKIYHAAAMARRRIIGKDNKLPWHFSCDLKYFKQLTSGSTVIMGRKTFESIGKPLPERQNFVLSRDGKVLHEGVRCFSSFGEAVKNVATPNAFIIGGGDLYRQTMDKVDGIYLTCIDEDYEGDTYYPEIPTAFREVNRQRLQDDPKIEVVFYERSLS